tara:strand:+ start:285 stop:908 length:624 start_codon:yes stop_codon:yes gene_type:complete
MDVVAEKDSSVAAVIAPYKTGVDSIMNEVLCISDLEMTKGRSQSLLGNFVTDLCLQQFADKADVCIMNNGGLRASLPKGSITRGKIYELMPFENELVVLELDENDFLGLLDYLVSRGGEPFSGLSLIMKGKDEYSSYQIHNEVNFKIGDKVRVITSDYLANGGDKMYFFKDKEQKKAGIKLRDAIINYCNSHDTISSKLDNRINIVE